MAARSDLRVQTEEDEDEKKPPKVKTEECDVENRGVTGHRLPAAEMPLSRQVVFTVTGKGVFKAITCMEIMKWHVKGGVGARHPSESAIPSVMFGLMFWFQCVRIQT